MVHELLTVDCSAVYVVSAYTQPSFNDKNPSSGFVFISLYVFPCLKSSCSTTRSHALPRLLIDSSVSTQTRPERAVIIDYSPSLLIHWSRMASKRLCCSVLGCNNKHRNHSDVPKFEQLKAQWLSFVCEGSIPHDQRQYFLVCANHFSPDCFINEDQYKAGFAKKLRLKK